MIAEINISIIISYHLNEGGGKEEIERERKEKGSPSVKHCSKFFGCASTEINKRTFIIF